MVVKCPTMVRWWPPLAAAFVMAAAPGRAAAVQGCPNPRNPGDIVVIGSLAELAGAVAVPRLKRILLAAFEMRFDKAGNDLQDNAEILYCDGREIGDSNAYSEGVVGVLNDERVLLEVGAKPAGSDIVVTYVVIPIRHYALAEHGPSSQGYYQALYEQSSISSGLAQLFKGNAELRLMAAAALALRYEKIADGESDAAQRQRFLNRSRAFYCDAVGSLEEAKPHGDALGLDSDEWLALHDFANDGAKRLFENATTDPSYSGGLTAVASERGAGSGSGSDADSSNCI
jgi:hypothetical protein